MSKHLSYAVKMKLRNGGLRRERKTYYRVKALSLKDMKFNECIMHIEGSGFPYNNTNITYPKDTTIKNLTILSHSFVSLFHA